MSTYLRACAKCTLAILANGDSGFYPAYCNRCQPNDAAQLAAVKVGDRVRVQPGAADPPWDRSAWIVSELAGDDLQLFVLGAPHRRIRTTVHQLLGGAA